MKHTRASHKLMGPNQRKTAQKLKEDLAKAKKVPPKAKGKVKRPVKRGS